MIEALNTTDDSTNDCELDDWDVPDSRVPIHGEFPKPFRSAEFNRLLVELQRPFARAALKKRRKRLLMIRETMKRKYTTGADLAFVLCKSSSQINLILRGGWPYSDAWQTPAYFERLIVARGYVAAEVDGDGLSAPPLETFVAEALAQYKPSESESKIDG